MAYAAEATTPLVSPDNTAIASIVGCVINGRPGGYIVDEPDASTSMPFTSALSETVVKVITICPEALAVAVNCSTTA